MGIYDRDYYRESTRDSTWYLGVTPVVRFLLIANVVVFLMQILIVRHPGPLEIMRKFDPELDNLLVHKEAGDAQAAEQIKIKYLHLDSWQSSDDRGWIMQREFQALFPPQHIVEEWFQLDTRKVVDRGQVWRLLTHAFCHDHSDLMHIVLNMLGLFWFGCTLESMYGSREFALFYFTSTLMAAAAFVALDLYTGSMVPAIGASGAVMGVLMLYTMHFPRSVVLVFWILPMEIRWLMAAFVIWDLHPVLLQISGERVPSGIGHAAHLGGLAFGFLYARFHWRLDRVSDLFFWQRAKWPRHTHLRLAPGTSRDEPENDELAEVDALLQKISESGQASLTDEEREVLKRASARLKKRANGDGT